MEINAFSKAMPLAWLPAKLMLILQLCLLMALPAMAGATPPITIHGKVTDTAGAPLQGATVAVKANGTLTRADGSYSLAVNTGDVVTVTFVGFNTYKFTVTENALIPEIKLHESSHRLNEVQIVSIGYGSQKKKDVTGAVSSISEMDFNQGAIVNPLSQIQGKVAGLVITQQGGDPNDQSAGVSIRGQTSITGDQSPLFVIDGVAASGSSQFQNLSPSDIESYDVLKDASATAIYGSRGANGVVLVTTKRGKAGHPTIDYNAYVSIADQAKYFDLLNPSEYLKAIAAIPGVNVATYAKGGNTNWQKAINRTALSHSNNVAIGGGTNEFNYRASVNYIDQQGLLINTDKKQLGLRLNAEQKALDDKLDIVVNISNTTIKRQEVPDGNVIGSYIFNAPPTYPVYNPDGSFNIFTDYNLANPIEHVKQVTNTETSFQTLANASANYSILPGMKLGVLGAYIADRTVTDYFQPTFPQEGNLNNANQNSYNNNTYEFNAHINFDRTYGKHSISATGLYEYNDFFTQGFYAGGQNYLVPGEADNNLGAGDQSKNSINSNKNEYRIISFLARVNYNYDYRFYVTASIRRDGSDKFGAHHQWGTFPSFDVAYRFKKDLLKNVDWVNDLKLRLGYGIVGNSSAIGPYSAITLFNAGTRYYDGSNTSYLYPASYQYSQNANPDLRWEERRGKNIGLDFALFGNRVTGDFNYFNDKTVNMLYNYSVPTPPFPYNTILANVGSLTNKGLEFALMGQAIKGKGLNWAINGQMTFVKTRIVNLSGSYQGYAVNSDQIITGYAAGRGLSSSPITYLKPGAPINEYYLTHFTGVDANGNEEFDGKTLAQNPTPNKYYIDPNPKFTYGFTNTFNYHNWSLSFSARGVYGQRIFNNVLLDYETITRLPGANTTKEALTNGIKDGLVVSDHWLEHASYLRLDNASLGYDFKNVKGFSTLHVYVAGNNLFVLTKYRGLDPELNSPYIDNNSYPKAIAFVIGTSISFK